MYIYTLTETSGTIKLPRNLLYVDLYDFDVDLAKYNF